jgi:glycerol-3-phosphate dehydrogenase
MRRVPEGAPLKSEFTRAFEYSDCWVDDARLVVLNALDAAERGAIVLTRTAAVSARRSDGLWQMEMRSLDGTSHRVTARVLVNTAGPWVEDVIGRIAGQDSRRQVRLVKGSHIVVPKFWQGAQAYLLQNRDKRVIFVNPYEGDLCLIGTTDIPYTGSPGDVAIDAEEIDYLIASVNRYFAKALTRGDVRHAFSGVRPLFDDKSANPSAVTRDYVLDVEGGDGEAKMLSVFGGKITTFRKLAEHAMAKLIPFLPKCGGAWTSRAKLPGGDIPGDDIERFIEQVSARYPFLPQQLARHYVRLYGTRAIALLGAAGSIADLGEYFGGFLYEREAHFLRETEWARTPADILDRRTKHGLHIDDDAKQSLQRWMEAG